MVSYLGKWQSNITFIDQNYRAFEYHTSSFCLDFKMPVILEDAWGYPSFDQFIVVVAKWYHNFNYVCHSTCPLPESDQYWFMDMLNLLSANASGQESTLLFKRELCYPSSPTDILRHGKWQILLFRLRGASKWNYKYKFQYVNRQSTHRAKQNYVYIYGLYFISRPCS